MAKLNKISLFLLLSLGLLSPEGVFALPSYVQHTTGFVVSDVSTQVTISGVTAGNLLVVASRISAVDSATTVTSAGEAWTRDASLITGNSLTVDVHSAIASGGDTTITISKSGSNTAFRVIVLEYNGTWSAARVHKISTNNGTSTTIDAGNITTEVNNCLLFVMGATNSDFLGWSAGSGFTMRNNPNTGDEPDQKIGVEDKIAATAGLYTGNGFTITEDNWRAAAVAYLGSSVSATATGLTITGGTIR